MWEQDSIIGSFEYCLQKCAASFFLKTSKNLSILGERDNYFFKELNNKFLRNYNICIFLLRYSLTYNLLDFWSANGRCFQETFQLLQSLEQFVWVKYRVGQQAEEKRVNIDPFFLFESPPRTKRRVFFTLAFFHPCWRMSVTIATVEQVLRRTGND